MRRQKARPLLHLVADGARPLRLIEAAAPLLVFPARQHPIWDAGVARLEALQESARPKQIVAAVAHRGVEIRPVGQMVRRASRSNRGAMRYSSKKKPKSGK